MGRRWRPLLSLLTIIAVRAFPQPTHDYFKGMFPIQPPHCSRTPIVIAQTSTDASSALSSAMQMQFYIGLHNTVCFRLNTPKEDNAPKDKIDKINNLDEIEESESSLLHTIRLDRLEHNHPISQRYEFGIPEVRADCVCECDRAATTCSAESHQFTHCPISDDDDMISTCYRTFFPNQAPAGCAAGSSPKLCCDVKFRPYRNQTYLAMKLEQPSTFATFIYTAYDFSHGRWIEKDRQTIRSQLDGGTQERYMDSAKHISLSVAAGGRATHQLETGMYFAQSNPGGEMDELRRQPLNEISDNNFDRLGWYRRGDDGRFHVNNGLVKMDAVHKAKVRSCKDQTYQSILAANNYMPAHFNLSRPLEAVHPWIESARMFDGNQRHAVVTHSEGANLHVTLQASGDVDGRRLVFFHNASRVDDFSGTIVVDSRSNRYFNLTVYGASGKINGLVKHSDNPNSDDIYSFTTYVHDLQASNRSMIIPLPAIVGEGARMVCLRPDEVPQDRQICHVVFYHEQPLEINLEDNTWHEMVGKCPTCNQVNLNGLTKYLNPMSWVNGVSSLGEFVMVATDVIVYVCVLVVVYIIITKIVIPIFKCWICPLYLMKSKRKKEKKKEKKKAEDDEDKV